MTLQVVVLGLLSILNENTKFFAQVVFQAVFDCGLWYWNVLSRSIVTTSSITGKYLQHRLIRVLGSTFVTVTVVHYMKPVADTIFYGRLLRHLPAEFSGPGVRPYQSLAITAILNFQLDVNLNAEVLHLVLSSFYRSTMFFEK